MVAQDGGQGSPFLGWWQVNLSLVREARFFLLHLMASGHSKCWVVMGNERVEEDGKGVPLYRGGENASLAFLTQGQFKRERKVTV